MTMTIKEFTIKPVSGHSFQERHLHRIQYKGSSGVQEEKILNKRKAMSSTGDSCTDDFCFQRPQYNRSKFDAGMTEQVSNPYYLPKEERIGDIETAVQELMSNKALHEDWRARLTKIVTLPKISRQEELELRFSLMPGVLTEMLPTERIGQFRSMIDPKVRRTMLMDFMLTLYDRSNIFSTDTIRGALAWQLAHRHPRIAASYEAINGGKHWWYISEEMEDEKVIKRVNDTSNKAIAKYVELQEKYPLTDVLEDNVIFFIASVCTRDEKPIVKGRTVPLVIDERINEFLKPRRKDEVAANVAMFLDRVEEFSGNPNLFYARYLVQQGFNVNTFQRNNGKVYWLSQKNTDDYTFTSTEKLINFVYENMSADDSEELKTLIAELKSKDCVIPQGLL